MSLITEVDILDEAKDNFLTYAEEVLTDRAIPAAEDGLLSAQRKILWTMEDYLKMDSKSKTKKCNAIIGSTLATSYFHGDIACYGVLRKMAQEFLMRYPLVTGQGQLGTQESNDMFSSSRYTEAKPSKFTDLMMNDFAKKVVPTKETYNGEFQEPVILPSLFPNAICNGRQAIGISMAHNSAPHNLTEVCNAAIALIEKGNLSIDEVLSYIPGPDFPLGGTVLNIKDVRTAFASGKSNVSLKIQGDYEIDGQDIIFTSIPYRTYRNKIKEQIEKNIDVLSEMIDDFDDESNIGQNRLVFHIKDGVSVSKALNKLFLLTDLQSTLSYNMNYIVNGTPKLCSMVDLLRAYVDHQEDVLINATTFDKEKAEARAHILEGLIAAVDKIDEVIALIKQSAGRADARTKLMEFLTVDEVQANAILDMKLGKLTRIDKEELVNELKEKRAFIEECVNLLTNKEIRNRVLIEKISKLRDTYGDARRTKLLNVDIPKQEKEMVVVEPKDCVVVVSKKNTIKRIDAKSFKAQKRNTVGVKTGDIIVFSQRTNTQDTLMVFSSKGKMYRILVDNIPEGTNASNGAPISSLIEFENGEVPMAFTTLTRDTDKKFIFFATKNGTIKKVPLNEYDKMKRTGIIAISFKDDDELADVTFINQEQMILVTKNGMTIRFGTAEMPISSRTAQGVKGMKLNDGDSVIAALPIANSADYLAIVSKNGLGKKIKIDELTLQNRGGKGLMCYKEEIAGAEIIKETDNLLINGNKSSIVISGKDIPTLGRVSMGNIMLKNNDQTISITQV
nr:MAG TPA: DNA gyrase subunit A [Caudoviricetes sp.]